MSRTNDRFPPLSKTFLSHDRDFYRSYFGLFLLLAMQNIITYSVNVADNVMLGSYSQTALSGAAAVNQIQYVLQSVTGAGLGEGMIVLSSQYWGRRDTDAIQRITAVALRCVWIVGALLTAAAFLVPRGMVGLFTSDADILAQGVAYLSVMRWSYLIFMTTSILLCMLRSVQVAGIAFRLSVMTLFVNVGINYCLIFGHFGLPEMGVKGAAIGTLIARCLELAVLLIYLTHSKKLPLRLSFRKLTGFDRSLMAPYLRTAGPCVVSAILFAGAVAMQTVIMGHLSADAIAANSAAGTMFQYCKMIPISASAAAGVWIGKTVGKGDFSELRAYVHTLQVIFIGAAVLFSTALRLIAPPLFALYDLTPQALDYAGQMITVMAISSLATGYQMPCLTGIIRGGGDTKYVMYIDITFSWFIVVPLSVAAAFLWHWPVWAVTLCLNIDQFIKCILNAVKTNRYTWIKRLAEPLHAAEP